MNNTKGHNSSPPGQSSKSNMMKVYFKRFQVKYMHRQAKKTNHQAVICQTTQDKNKYNTLKYRYVVKFTNKDIVIQIITYATKICW
jgi:large subunit ribosomal protein L5e